MSSDSEDASCSDDEEYVPAEGEASDDDQGCLDENDKDSDEPEDDESAKKEIDKIWNDFKSELASVDRTKVKSSDSKKQEAEPLETKEQSALSKNNGTKKTDEEKKTVTVTKVFDFAGEEVKVTREVDKDSKEAKNLLKHESVSTNSIPKPGISQTLKRPGGGLQGVLGKIGKKPKMSTLEKSKLDWQDYKQKEGIEEELQTHNKGKGGYLENQSFLQRTDLRLFEKEREMRLGKRGKR